MGGMEGRWEASKAGGGEEVKDFSSSSEEGKVRKCQKVPFWKLFFKKSFQKARGDNWRRLRRRKKGGYPP